MLSLGQEDDCLKDEGCGEKEGSGDAMQQSAATRLGQAVTGTNERYDGGQYVPCVREAVQVSGLSRALWSLRNHLEVKGIVEARKPVTADSAQRARDKMAGAQELAQLAHLEQHLRQVTLPVRAGRLLGWALHHREDLSLSDATDLVAVCEGLVRYGWPE